MGHRALVAVERSDGRYVIYRDQWAGVTLFTGTDPAETVADAVASSRRLATGCTVREVLDALDPREYEALFVRDRRGDVSAFLVVWTGLETATGPVGGGVALVPVVDAGQARRVEQFLRAARGLFGDAADLGGVSAPVAVQWLRVALEAHPTVPAETVWLPADAPARRGSS